MRIPATKVPPALKHGAYSKVTLLPGEDRAAFEELHRGLVAEFAPHGRMEEETVATIAHVMWRRRNLAMLEIGPLFDLVAEGLGAAAEESHKHENSYKLSVLDKMYRHAQRDHEAAERDRKGAAAVKFLDLRMKQLEVEERLDAMIDRQIKRLLFVRGLKSIPPSTTIAHPSTTK
jgi:hypothetical protein